MSSKIIETYWQFWDSSLQKTLIRGVLIVDTVANLPGIDDITGYRLTAGCVADIIDTAARYKLNFDGNWYVQESGTDFYTKAQIDAMLEDVDEKFDDYQPLLTFDSIPTENSNNPVYSGGAWSIVEALTNRPGKNRLQNNGVSTTAGGEVEFTVNADGTVTAEVIATTTAARSLSWYFNCPAGTWQYSTGQAASGAYPAICYSYLYDNSGIANDYSGEAFTMEEDKSIRCFIQIRSNTPAGTVLTFKPMICLPIEYAISPKYVPYA